MHAIFRKWRALSRVFGLKEAAFGDPVVDMELASMTQFWGRRSEADHARKQGRHWTCRLDAESGTAVMRTSAKATRMAAARRLEGLLRSLNT